MAELTFKNVKKRFETIININCNKGNIKIIRGVFYPILSFDNPKTNREFMESYHKKDFDNVPMHENDSEIVEFILNELNFKEIQNIKNFICTSEGALFYKINLFEN
jgi:hypothetical protein